MLPLLLVVLVGVLEMGALRAIAHRAGAAADLATIVAVGDQDQLEAALSGALYCRGSLRWVTRTSWRLPCRASCDSPPMQLMSRVITSPATFLMIRRPP